MSYQTVVAAFDTQAHAQAAVDALKAGGFHADDISMFDKNRVGLREPGLWQRIFGGGLAQHEADVYTQSLDRGGMLVSVRVPDSEVAHATGILDIHRPIDVHDRAITTGIAPVAKVEAAVASIAAKPLEAAGGQFRHSTGAHQHHSFIVQRIEDLAGKADGRRT